MHTQFEWPSFSPCGSVCRVSGHAMQRVSPAPALAIRQTGHVAERLDVHRARHWQSPACVQGVVTSPVTVASIRSKQTGQVGSSYVVSFGTFNNAVSRASGPSAAVARSCSSK